MTWATDDREQPDFPPLITGRPVAAAHSAYEAACEQAAGKQAGAGDLFWSQAEDVADLAIVLEPEVPAARAVEMLFAAMVAAGDSFGALAPSELGMFYRWPSLLSVNDGKVGEARIAMARSNAEAVPDWLVVGLNLRLFDARERFDTGHDLANSCLWNEGCGEITSRQLIESISRHILTWINIWSDDGFRPVHQAWLARAEGRDRPVTLAWQGETLTGRVAGLDENGNLLFTPEGGAVRQLDISEAVDWR